MADNRIYNFSAGPSMLPVPVLERCASEMLNYKGLRHVSHGDESPI